MPEGMRLLFPLVLPVEQFSVSQPRMKSELTGYSMICCEKGSVVISEAQQALLVLHRAARWGISDSMGW